MGLGLSAVGASATLIGCQTLANTTTISEPKPIRQAGHFSNIIVGSGYGGAVSTLRLTEQGHKVLIL